MIEAMEQFIRIDERVKEVQRELAELKKSRSDVEKIVLEQMAVNGVDQMKIKGKTLFPRREISVSAKDPQLLEEVLKYHGYQHCLGVKTQTLKSQIREYMGDERDETKIPEEIRGAIDLYQFTKLSVRSS